MLIKASPFSPMEKRQSSSEEEVSADLLAAEEEEKEPEGKNDRKARLVPKKGSQERGRAERRRSRSPSVALPWTEGTAQTGKRRREKEKNTRGRSQASRDRRGSQAPPSPAGPPPPKPGEKSPQKQRAHADTGKGGGKNLKGGPKKQVCKICGSRVAGTSSALDQHQWLSEYCLAWQAYERMTPYQRDQQGSWEKAKKIGQDVKSNRVQLDATSAGRSAQTMTGIVPERAVSVASSHRERPPSLPREVSVPRKGHGRRKDARSSSSSGRAAKKEKRSRHNVVINFHG